jgi:hypothetical protein
MAMPSEAWITETLDGPTAGPWDCIRVVAQSVEFWLTSLELEALYGRSRPQGITDALRARNVSVVTAQDDDHTGADDSVLLARAAELNEGLNTKAASPRRTRRVRKIDGCSARAALNGLVRLSA